MSGPWQTSWRMMTLTGENHSVQDPVELKSRRVQKRVKLVLFRASCLCVLTKLLIKWIKEQTGFENVCMRLI